MALTCVALSELRLNSSLVRYLRQYEGVDASASALSASEATSQQYQPWSLDRRFSEADIQTIISEFLSGTPKHELARRYSVSLSGIKNLLRRRGIRRDGRRGSPD
jgi:Mor family transcriptional regulator